MSVEISRAQILPDSHFRQISKLSDQIEATTDNPILRTLDQFPGQLLEQAMFANQVFRFLVIGQQAVYQLVAFSYVTSSGRHDF